MKGFPGVQYTRVSSARQKVDCKRQCQQVEGDTGENHWEIDEVYQDIASGVNNRR
ncbi:MAG: recombinase family protein [Candidatus Hermodarchaeota archaeon]